MDRTYFLSYKQEDQNDGAVQMLYTLLPKGKSWLDKFADDRSKDGMVTGVKESDVFVAIISPRYFSSYFCCLEMHTALSEGKRILVVWNQSKFTVQQALAWIPSELSMLTSNELLPIMEDIQMATPCVDRLRAEDGCLYAVLSRFGTNPTTGEPFSFGLKDGLEDKAAVSA